MVKFTPLITPDEHIPAVLGLNTMLKESLSPYNISHHFVYGSWETDIIIGGELWRNILLSMACVVVVTLLLLCNLTVCLTVVTMVTMTLTNVVGYLHYWDSTIDIISCICVVLSIGLSVDYSVHIGHAYLVAEGEISDKLNNTSLAAQGALPHRLQRRTACKIQKLPTGSGKVFTHRFLGVLSNFCLISFLIRALLL